MQMRERAGQRVSKKERKRFDSHTWLTRSFELQKSLVFVLCESSGSLCCRELLNLTLFNLSGFHWGALIPYHGINAVSLLFPVKNTNIDFSGHDYGQTLMNRIEYQ